MRCGAPGAYQQVKVRIAAIDAPESRQAFGQKSRQNLARLCFRQRATLQPVDEDSYGRTVAHVRCGSTDVATAQVRAGLAWVYTPYAESRPQLVALHDDDGGIVAAAGYRSAADGPLFLERYLAAPVEALLGAAGRPSPGRGRIVEVGHLAGGRSGAGRRSQAQADHWCSGGSGGGERQ